MAAVAVAVAVMALGEWCFLDGVSSAHGDV